MSRPTIFDGETQREMSDDEYAQWLKDEAQAQAQAEAQEQDNTARAAKRQQALDKLGLTADETAALFG